jgi:regulator of cell morphogenesis and NO signaling
MVSCIANHIPSAFGDLRAPRLAQKVRDTAASGGEGSLAALIAEIVGRHHESTRSALLRLSAMTARVNAHDRAQAGVQTIVDEYQALDGELRAHMTKEEAIIFPYIVSLEMHLLFGRTPVRSPFGVLERPLRVMLDEQSETQSLLASMRQLTGGYVAPVGASPAVGALYAGLAALELLLGQHARLETEVLFPRALELEQRVRG